VSDGYLAFSPNGKLLGFLAQDHTVRLWSLVTAREVMRLNELQAPIGLQCQRETPGVR
jgi:hypothetical protein